MSLISNITSVLKTFFLNNKLIIVGVLAISTLFFVNRYNYHRYEEQKQVSERLSVNLQAANDTIRVVKAKDGTLAYQKLTSVVKDNAELKQTNADLYNETLKLQGTIENIQKVQYVLKTDTQYITSTSTLIDSGKAVDIASSFDSTYSPGNYRHLKINASYNFHSGISRSILVNDEIGFTAVTGLLKTAKGYEIFVNPKYPGLTVQHLEGAIIDPTFFGSPAPKTKQHLITFGASLGFVPLAYEINNKKLDLNLTRVGASFGINFNLFR